METAAASPSAKKSWKESMKAPVKELTPVKKCMPSIPDSTLDKEATASKELAKASTPDKASTPEASDKESTPSKESSSDNAHTPDKVSTPEKEPVKETVIALEADEEEEKAVMEPILLSAAATTPATTTRNEPETKEEEEQQPPLPRPWREMKSRTGQKYYYNKDTGKSTWDRPTEERRRPSAEQQRLGHRSRDEPRPVAQNLVHRPVVNRPSPPSYDRYHRVRYQQELWMPRRDGRGIRVREAYYYGRDYGRISRGYR
ncbi:hypothetical protein BJV82DRAFT_66148 [Fennellomyces sp. T-0311]|nr:hypothetical protein BJV82DRAFT_66148 [Fennellomyces sp. T-0311]